MENVILDAVELETVGHHLLDELCKSVQQHNWLERLGHRVGGLARFWDDNQHAVLEVQWPMPHRQAYIGNREQNR